MKKALVILTAVLVVVSMFTGCKKEPEIKSYTVTFDVNGGKGTIDPQTVIENEKATKPAADPTYAGAVFQGWSATKDGTTAFDFNTPITADTTLYAMWKTYTVGGTGPAGGVVFYDVDADNNETQNDGLTSAELGWRYLEVAPEDLTEKYTFGFYRTTVDGENTTLETETAIGTGKSNTDKLVNTMGETTYLGVTGTDKGTYAAKACADYTYGGYDDWFLPSKDELIAMYTILWCNEKGGTWQDYYYCSSSENNGTSAWQVSFNLRRYINPTGRNSNGYVRAIRAF